MSEEKKSLPFLKVENRSCKKKYSFIREKKNIQTFNIKDYVSSALKLRD
jgi:hypothetical protein